MPSCPEARALELGGAGSALVTSWKEKKKKRPLADRQQYASHLAWLVYVPGPVHYSVVLGTFIFLEEIVEHWATYSAAFGQGALFIHNRSVCRGRGRSPRYNISYQKYIKLIMKPSLLYCLIVAGLLLATPDIQGALPAPGNFYRTGDLWLDGGRAQGTGTLLVYVNGTWGFVCDDGWNVDSAHVACRSLGYPQAFTETVEDEFDFAKYSGGKEREWTNYSLFSNLSPSNKNTLMGNPGNDAISRDFFLPVCLFLSLSLSLSLFPRDKHYNLRYMPRPAAFPNAVIDSSLTLIQLKYVTLQNIYTS